VLSARRAAPLEEFNGQSYSRVIVGLPAVRYTLQIPRMACAQVASVKEFVESTPNFRALAAQRLQSQHGRPSGRKVLSFIQRTPKEGRVLQNLTEVIRAMEANVNISRGLDVRIVRGLSKGWPWTQQYHAIRTSDIIVSVGGAALGWLWALPHGGAAIELRSAGSPIWLTCSERWDVDWREMFGGLARLAGVHHICVRPHAVDLTVEAIAGAAGLSDPSSFTPYERDVDIYVHPQRAVQLAEQALLQVTGPPPPCLDHHPDT